MTKWIIGLADLIAIGLWAALIVVLTSGEYIPRWIAIVSLIPLSGLYAFLLLLANKFALQNQPGARRMQRVVFVVALFVFLVMLVVVGSR